MKHRILEPQILRKELNYETHRCDATHHNTFSRWKIGFG
jgi:hypothetical protein